jgi:hypothetical protein
MTAHQGVGDCQLSKIAILAKGLFGPFRQHRLSTGLVRGITPCLVYSGLCSSLQTLARFWVLYQNDVRTGGGCRDRGKEFQEAKCEERPVFCMRIDVL